MYHTDETPTEIPTTEKEEKKMKRWITYTAALVLVPALSGWTPADANDTRDGRARASFVDEDGDGIHDNVTFKHRFGRRGRWARRGLRGQLTEEQRAALKEKIAALKAEDATKAEIRAAIDAQFEEWGIEAPERSLGRLGSLLTEEQQTALKEKIGALKAEDATRAEIREAIGAQLEEWDIEVPERGSGRLGSLLTEEQHVALREKIDALKAEDATRAEIHTAIHAELEALGIEAPTKGFRRRGFGRRGGFKGHGDASQAD